MSTKADWAQNPPNFKLTCQSESSQSEATFCSITLTVEGKLEKIIESGEIESTFMTTRVEIHLLTFRYEIVVIFVFSNQRLQTSIKSNKPRWSTKQIFQLANLRQNFKGTFVSQ